MKQRRFFIVPILHGLDRCFGVQGRLRQLLVVQMHVALQGLPHVLAGYETVRLEYIANAPIEALDHAVGLGCSGFRQPVLNAQLLA